MRSERNPCATYYYISLNKTISENGPRTYPVARENPNFLAFFHSNRDFENYLGRLSVKKEKSVSGLDWSPIAEKNRKLFFPILLCSRENTQKREKLEKHFKKIKFSLRRIIDNSQIFSETTLTRQVNIKRNKIKKISQGAQT